ncbi:MAG: GIY-YIG nuclease family protein [Deltaproteobacteria bacterium]|nr:MAG: GIY-YIG nuclease family protein [Deltaproteobacteria bacterium]
MQTYTLIIELEKDRKIGVGKLGVFNLPRGFYLYTGSGGRNISARLARHRKKRGKRLHWHIDYLLRSRHARIIGVRESSGEECAVNQAFKRIKGARIPVPGFGASDCRKDCLSHLIYFKKRPILPSSRPSP